MKIAQKPKEVRVRGASLYAGERERALQHGHRGRVPPLSEDVRDPSAVFHPDDHAAAQRGAQFPAGAPGTGAGAESECGYLPVRGGHERLQGEVLPELPAGQ